MHYSGNEIAFTTHFNSVMARVLLLKKKIFRKHLFLAIGISVDSVVT